MTHDEYLDVVQEMNVDIAEANYQQEPIDQKEGFIRSFLPMIRCLIILSKYGIIPTPPTRVPITLRLLFLLRRLIMMLILSMSCIQKSRWKQLK